MEGIMCASQRFRLMPELLLATFDHLDRRDLRTSAHTCHDWRASAINHPECLWNLDLHVQVDAQMYQLKKLLADFRQSVEHILGVDLKINLVVKITGTTSPGNEFSTSLFYSTGLELLHTIMPCVWALDLSEDGLAEAEGRLFGTLPPAPNLCQLRIYVKPSGLNGMPRNLRIPVHIFGGQAPRLRRLDLAWITLPPAYVPAFIAVTHISALSASWTPVHPGTDAATYLQYRSLSHLQIADKLVGELATRTQLLQQLQYFETRMPFNDASGVNDAPAAWIHSLSKVPTLTFAHANVWEGDYPNHAVVALAKAMKKPLSLSHADCSLNDSDYYAICNDQRATLVLWPQRTELFTHRPSDPFITIRCCRNYHVIAPYLRFLDLQLSQLHWLTHRWEQIRFAELEDLHIRLPHTTIATCPDCSHTWRPSHPTTAPFIAKVRLSHVPAEDGPSAPSLLAWETASQALSCVTTQKDRVELWMQHNFFEETDPRHKPKAAWYARSRGAGQGLEAVAEDHNSEIE